MIFPSIHDRESQKLRKSTTFFIIFKIVIEFLVLSWFYKFILQNFEFISNGYASLFITINLWKLPKILLYRC